MNLRSLTDEELLVKTDQLVRNEREILIQVLYHLREIERRRLYSALKQPSLFSLAMSRFGYSEDQAARRISAMRLLKELPEMEEMIASGEISLSHIGVVSALFKQEKKLDAEMSRTQKLDLIEKVSGTSVREAQRIALSLATDPVALKPDRVQVLSENHIELKFTASLELIEKIEKLKGLLAHKHPGISLGQLFEKLANLGLEELDPRKITRKTATSRVNRTQKAESKPMSQAQIRRTVYKNAENRCENCGSTFAFQIDHRTPKALGGSNKLENFRLLCRSCNQRAAIDVFGIDKMEPYLDRSVAPE